MQIDIDQRACAQVTQETQGKVFQTVSQTFGFIVFKKLNLVFKCVIPCFNLTRMGVGAKRLHTSFSTGTSTNVWICPQNFLTFSFKPFATLLLNFKATPSTGPKLLNWIQEHPSKKFIFCSNSNKMVMVTSVIKMLKLPHNQIYSIIASRDKILLLTTWAEIMDVKTFISKSLYFKKA